MGFLEAVQWWEEWQLRVLVLGSLFLQYFLHIASALRKRRIPGWFRFLTWLAYLGCDALAIYALATLFNRQRKQEWTSTHRSSAGLEVLWAPVLLLHLGGQDGITAYNIEDNELWRRHVLTAVSQVTVAIYVFCKSWSGDKKLLQAAILFFVPGILRCFQKPWALKNASINSLVSSSGRLDENDGIGEINSLEVFVQAATLCFQASQADHPPDHGVEDKPYNLFVDLAYPYSVRLKNLKYMAHHQGEAHRLVQSGLSTTFDRLYTKEQVSKGIKLFCDWSRRGCFGQIIEQVVGYLILAATMLFLKSHKEAYDDTDVKVTYILLCGTAAIELFSVKLCFDVVAFIFGPPWPDQVAQYNLIGYLARDRKHNWFRMLATSLRCKDYLDQLWCMEPCDSSSDITELVYGHVEKGWKHHINDTASYRAFNDNRGQLTLRREGRAEVEWSLRRPFDESVLLWHLATDFCFSKMGVSHDNQTSRRCRVMSNYMACLLFVNSEMLMAGTRRSLFGAAYDELNKMLKEKPESVETERERELTQKIIQQVSTPAPASFVSGAWKLAEALMGLGNDEEKIKMWRVIQGVWVEMLCFSAGRCRGYLHAKSLGKGGEYLSYVWLLLSYMGMETLAERLQRTELQEDRDKGAAGLTPTRAATGDDNA